LSFSPVDFTDRSERLLQLANQAVLSHRSYFSKSSFSHDSGWESVVCLEIVGEAYERMLAPVKDAVTVAYCHSGYGCRYEYEEEADDDMAVANWRGVERGWSVGPARCHPASFDVA